MNENPNAAATGGPLMTLQGHKSGVTRVAVFANGQRALSASNDDTLKVWDLATGDVLLSLHQHGLFVTRGIPYANGTRALSASADLAAHDLGSRNRSASPDNRDAGPFCAVAQAHARTVAGFQGDFGRILDRGQSVRDEGAAKTIADDREPLRRVNVGAAIRRSPRARATPRDDGARSPISCTGSGESPATSCSGCWVTCGVGSQPSGCSSRDRWWSPWLLS